MLGYRLGLVGVPRVELGLVDDTKEIRNGFPSGDVVGLDVSRDLQGLFESTVLGERGVKSLEDPQDRIDHLRLGHPVLFQHLVLQEVGTDPDFGLLL